MGAGVEKGEFLHVRRAALGQAYRGCRFADQTAVRQIFAGGDDAGDVVVAGEVRFDLAARTDVARLLEVVEYQRKQRGRSLGNICVDRCQRRLDVLLRLLRIQEVRIHRLEEVRIEREGLGQHFPVGKQTPA